jgi:hypothetical protein
MRQGTILRCLCAGLLAAALVVPHSGCAIAGAVMYWVKGNKVEARCTALEGKRVAVVCVSGSGVGPLSEGETLAGRVGLLLSQNVKKIELVSAKEVADWRDQNNWDQVDYKSIGRGVKADMVLAIDLETFSIHDDKTLLRGRAKIKSAVYDMTSKGQLVFSDGPKEFIFPEHGAQHVIENELNFKRIYLDRLAKDIATKFYAYDKIDDFAQEAVLAN